MNMRSARSNLRGDETVNKLFAHVALLASLAIAALPMKAQAWQQDTNTTTVPTQYTPRHPGDILVGSLGGTDTVWFAQATAEEPSTNDWVAYTVGAPNATVAPAGTFGVLTIGTNLVNGSGSTNGVNISQVPQYPMGAASVTNMPAATNALVWLKFAVSNRPGVIPWLPLNN
jgi:hypothetical protein